MKKIAHYPILLSLLLAACAPQAGGSSGTLIKEGKIKVINEKHLLIQEQSSVVALDFDGDSAKQLLSQYRAGQDCKLVAFKEVDTEGNSSETIKAIIFEDGRRFNISG